MQTIYSLGFDKPVMIIQPGEYYACGGESIISTVLGSCIAVALYDKILSLGGINHFMLPGAMTKAFYISESGKYGINAMELLINSLLKLGTRRDRLEAKVFGGGTILNIKNQMRATNVAQDNIKFALDFLETEKIHIRACDVGGTHARKILFFPESGKVLLKRISGSFTEPIKLEEVKYRERLKEEMERGGNFYSFKNNPR